MPGPSRPAIEHTIPTQTHGRYLVSAAAGPDAPLLVGFHGYGETAEDELARLQTIPDSDRWTLVSIQGLHQFYRRRTNEIVASWMTRQNREQAIEDNVAYVANLLRQYSGNSPLVLTGFSQGVAMAFRAATSSNLPVSGLIVCGGDVPPELDAEQLKRIPHVLIGRGIRDQWYTEEKFEDDKQRLRAADISVRTAILDTGHEWTPQFSEACAEFLRSI